MNSQDYPAPSDNQSEAKPTVLDSLLFFAGHQRLVVGFPIAAGLLALIVSLLLPNWYAATVRIMPPQQSQSNAIAILGQLGALAGSANQALGLKNPSDIYVAMLKSRTIADRLIDRFDLKKVYGEHLYYYARKELSRNSVVSASREGVITIEVEDKDPKRAAELANAYIEELHNLTIHLAISEASQRRLFFETQLKKAKADLIEAESQLTKFAETSGVVSPSGQIGLSVATSAALRAQIAAREIQLKAMRTFATDSNPDIVRTTEELAGLRAELAKMEKQSGSMRGDPLVPFDKAPKVGLEYVRRYRDMKYYETLYEVLAKQYEIARIDESKDATLIQTLDVAIPPERRSKPRPFLISGIAFLSSALIVILIGLFFEHLTISLRNPRLAAKWQKLRLLVLRKRGEPVA